MDDFRPFLRIYSKLLPRSALQHKLAYQQILRVFFQYSICGRTTLNQPQFTVVYDITAKPFNYHYNERLSESEELLRPVFPEFSDDPTSQPGDLEVTQGEGRAENTPDHAQHHHR